MHQQIFTNIDNSQNEKLAAGRTLGSCGSNLSKHCKCFSYKARTRDAHCCAESTSSIKLRNGESKKMHFSCLVLDDALGMMHVVFEFV